MSLDREAAATIVKELEASWNAADGARFGVPFTDDADFVTIRGEHLRSREAIAKGHQGIFDSARVRCARHMLALTSQLPRLCVYQPMATIDSVP
jgi:uncharacterized protein (TIGR02246 family)